MSVSGALSAAVSGLQVQGRALGTISDNIANVNTSGYKRVETRFSTLVTVSNAQVHQPGGVRSTPYRTNDIQGSVTSTGLQTNLAIAGDGFFSVSKVETVIGGLPAFEPDALFTRAGDFSVDKHGFLVNSAGYYLNAWSVADGPNRLVDRTSAEPIRISQLRDSPKATSLVEYAANLPATVRESLDIDGTTETDIDLQPTQVLFYDALGNEHIMSVQWTKDQTPYPNTNSEPPENTWYVSFSAPGVSFQNHPSALNASNTVDKLTYKVVFYGQDEGSALAGGIKNISQLYNNPSLLPQNDQARDAAIGALQNIFREDPNAGAAVYDDAGGTDPANPGAGALDTYGVYDFGTIGNPASFSAGTFATVPLGDIVDPTGRIEIEVGGVTYFGQLLMDANGLVINQQVTLTDGGGNGFNFMLEAQGDANDIADAVNGTAHRAELTADIRDALALVSRAAPYSGPIGNGVRNFSIFGNPPSFGTNAFAGLTVGQDGQASVTITDSNGNPTTYTGKVPMNSRGIITGPLSLRNSSNTAGFDFEFSTAWDLNGGNGEQLLTSVTGIPAQIDLPLVYAGAGTNYFTVNPRPVTQAVTFDFGNYGQADRLTQYAGDDIDGVNTRQDGVPPGSFRDLSIDELGFVTLNYDNGQRRTYFQIPVAQFNNPNALQLLQGNAFGATFDSGAANYSNPGGNGSGTVVASSLEGSNVDIADEFSKMITTQRAYSANARVVTTADKMLEEVVNIVR